jgi:hypothetical protein
MKILWWLINIYFNTVINSGSAVNMKYDCYKKAIFIKNIQEWFAVDYKVQ